MPDPAAPQKDPIIETTASIAAKLGMAALLRNTPPILPEAYQGTGPGKGPSVIGKQIGYIRGESHDLGADGRVYQIFVHGAMPDSQTVTATGEHFTRMMSEVIGANPDVSLAPGRRGMRIAIEEQTPDGRKDKDFKVPGDRILTWLQGNSEASLTALRKLDAALDRNPQLRDTYRTAFTRAVEIETTFSQPDRSRPPLMGTKLAHSMDMGREPPVLTVKVRTNNPLLIAKLEAREGALPAAQAQVLTHRNTGSGVSRQVFTKQRGVWVADEQRILPAPDAPVKEFTVVGERGIAALNNAVNDAKREMPPAARTVT
jgi:hypothetical protein